MLIADAIKCCTKHRFRYSNTPLKFSYFTVCCGGFLCCFGFFVILFLIFHSHCGTCSQNQVLKQKTDEIKRRVQKFSKLQLWLLYLVLLGRSAVEKRSLFTVIVLEWCSWLTCLCGSFLGFLFKYNYLDYCFSNDTKHVLLLSVLCG